MAAVAHVCARFKRANGKARPDWPPRVGEPMKKIMYAALVATLVGCGGGGHDTLSTRAKDDSASVPADNLADKPKTIGEAPPTRGDAFVDQTSAVHYGPSKYWIDKTGLGQNNNMTYTYVNGASVSNWMLWRSSQPKGRYELQVFIPRNYANAQSAKYRIIDGSTTKSTVTVNQNAYSDAWVSLGTFDFAGEPCVSLGDDTGESYSTKRMVGFDAVRFLQKSTGGGSISVPPFCQTNPNWASKHLGKGDTMGKIGCLVTSLSSIAAWAGTNTDPGKFCDWLSANKGFASDGSWINDDKLREYTGGKVRITGSKSDWESKAADPNVAVAEIDAGRPIVLKVHYKDSTSNSYQHWVVAVSYTRTGSDVTDFAIMDPMNANGGTVSLKDRYLFGGTFAKKVYGAKLVSK